MVPPVHSPLGVAGGATPGNSCSKVSQSENAKDTPVHAHSSKQTAMPPLSASAKHNGSSAFKSTNAQSSNPLSVLSNKAEDDDKEDLPPKRPRKPTQKVIESLGKGIEGLTKVTEVVSKRRK